MFLPAFAVHFHCSCGEWWDGTGTGESHAEHVAAALARRGVLCVDNASRVTMLADEAEERHEYDVHEEDGSVLVARWLRLFVPSCGSGTPWRRCCARRGRWLIGKPRMRRYGFSTAPS